jgi:hypothetical protein
MQDFVTGPASSSCWARGSVSRLDKCRFHHGDADDVDELQQA